MYLRVNEERYVSDSSNDDDNLLVEPYVCLFDSEWKVVDEVFLFLENRLHSKNLTFNTVATKGSDLKLFYDFLVRYKLSYKEISQKEINDFIAWLMLPESHDSQSTLSDVQSKRTAKTVNRIVSSVRDFYRYNKSVNQIKDPFKHASETIRHPTHHKKGFYAHTQDGLVEKSIFKIKEFDKGIRVLTKEQIDTILSNCTMERDRLLFELLLFTGMRIGEALSLDIHAIGLSHLNETVQDLPLSSNENDYLKGSRQRQQKSGTRDLFIPTELMKKLTAYYEHTWLDIYSKKEMEHEFFFISEFHNNLGEPLSYQAVWDRCRKIGKKCGIFFTPHDFRHTFATTLARNKVGIERLRKLLGHRDLASTDVYIQIANKEEIVEDLIPFYESYGL